MTREETMMTIFRLIRERGERLGMEPHAIEIGLGVLSSALEQMTDEELTAVKEEYERLQEEV